jgi:ubiquinone/menaquinone biosynthesis C-methylase UbiE
MKTEFDKFAEDYDELCNFYKEDIKFYKNQALKINGKVLEVGCGTGRIYLELLKKGVDIYGIDISKKDVKKIKRKLDKIKGIQELR